MRPAHAAQLLAAGQPAEIWEWMPTRPISAETVDAWLATAMQAESHGREYPFIVVRLSDSLVIGSTRYLDVQQDDRTVEIGWTWYTPEAWGGMVNPEAKYLLMRHAFATAAAEGAEKLSLAVDAANAPALALYRRHNMHQLCARLALIRELR